jgi:hypothetical protein
MRAAAWFVVAMAGSLAGHEEARAADAPAFVIPGKPGVPVIINGYDASYAIVEGDWGLDRPTGVPPTIVSGPLPGRPPARYGAGYFPSGDGDEPGYGRLEVIPPANRRLPPPAQRFHRSWGTQSESTPATIDAPATTPLVVAPEVNIGRQTARRNATDTQPPGGGPKSQGEKPNDSKHFAHSRARRGGIVR